MIGDTDASDAFSDISSHSFVVVRFMLRLSDEQISALSEMEFNRFISDQSRDSAGWLHPTQPPLQFSETEHLCRGLRQAAAEHGIYNTAALACLCQLSHLLGPCLLSDPSMPWIQRILLDATIPDGITRVNVIHAHAGARLEEWFPEGNGRKAALQNLLSNWADHTTQQIAEIVLPSKYADLTTESLTKFLTMSDALSDGSAQVPSTLRVGLDFLFGVGWLEHPAGRSVQANQPLSEAGVIDVLQGWTA